MPFFISWKFVEIINIQNAHTLFRRKTQLALIITTCETSKIHKKEFIDPKILNWIIDKKSYRERDAKEEERMNGKKKPVFMPTSYYFFSYALYIIIIFILYCLPKTRRTDQFVIVIASHLQKTPKFNVFLSYTRAPSNEF